jgi:hypothetical protein
MDSHSGLVIFALHVFFFQMPELSLLTLTAVFLFNTHLNILETIQILVITLKGDSSWSSGSGGDSRRMLSAYLADLQPSPFTTTLANISKQKIPFCFLCG